MRALKHRVSVCLAIVLCFFCIPLGVQADDDKCDKHNFTLKVCEDKYLATAENGAIAPTYYYCCENCGEAGSRRFKAERILFIGNSKTITHGSPAYSFETLSKYNNKGAIITVCAVPSYTLTQLLEEPVCYDIIKKKAYDKVIIQENSSVLWNPVYDSNILSSFKKISNLVIDNNPNVKVYIRCPALGKEYKKGTFKRKKDRYEFFSFLNENKNELLKKDTAYYLGKKGFFSYSANRGVALMRVRACNTLVKKSNRGGLILDADVMYGYKELSGKDNIWDKDRFHQNEIGACLLAASFYRAIYDENPKMNRKSFSHQAAESLVVDQKTYATSYNDICEAMSKKRFRRFRKSIYKLLDEIYGSKK